MNIKKILLLIVACFSAILMSSSMAFSDLPKDHWAYDKIMKMQDKGIIRGFEDNTFKPNQSITREQFASILSNTFNMDDKKATINFADVSNLRWSKKYIDNVSEYLTGYYYNGQYYFKPTDYAVREDMAVAIVKANKLENERPDYSVLDRFRDEDKISPNIRKYVAIAVKHGYMSGNTNGTFNPLGNLTRAEVAALMDNVMEKVALDDVETEGEETFKVISVSPKDKEDYVGEDFLIRVKFSDRIKSDMDIMEYVSVKDENGKELRRPSVTVGRDYFEIEYKNADYSKCNVKISRNILSSRGEKLEKDYDFSFYNEEYDAYNVNIIANGAKISGNGEYNVKDDVEIIVTPNLGYKFVRIEKVTGIDIDDLDIKRENKNVKLRFTMPKKDVKIQVKLEWGNFDFINW